MRQLVFLARLIPLVSLAAAGACSKDTGAAATDGAADAATDGRVIVLCPEVDADSLDAGSGAGDDAGSGISTDEFGPNAPAIKTASSMGRVNIYEIASPHLLERIDVFLRADLERTRITIAIQEATTRTGAFRKLKDVQLDVGSCQGWATSGPLAIPLEAGRYYAIGLDPNQAITPFVSVDGETLPIDGAFGRLIGSKAATSVSVPTITWEKFTDKEYNRQRLLTSPRAGDPAPDGGILGEAGVPGDAGTADAVGGIDAPRG